MLFRSFYDNQDNLIFKFPLANNNLFVHTYKEFMLHKNNRENKFLTITEIVKLLTKSKGIKLIELSMLHKFNTSKHYPEFNTFNYVPGNFKLNLEYANKFLARDVGTSWMAHPGIFHQDKALNYILDHIN